MTDVADKLRRARALVERGWCRNAFAKNGRRDLVWPTDVDACRWCAGGALRKVDPRDHTDMLFYLRRAAGRCDIAGWNDEQKSKRPVLAAFDKAIELAERDQ